MKNLFLFLCLFLVAPAFVKAQTNNYTGELEGKKIKGSMTFHKDETVTGSFFYVSSPEKVYKISGTNFVQGQVEIIVSYAGKRVSNGSLTKTLTDAYIVWEGSLMLENGDGESSYFIFRRPR
ncbi:MAG: hypothetical protein ACK45H_10170 [Bacteroidota bacterium]|jgi:hypothetical protein